MTGALQARLAFTLAGLELCRETSRIGAAVSGGGDSMAMLSLLSGWCADNEVELLVASVDHRLRDGSAAECELAEELARRLGRSHTILRRQHGLVGRNLQMSARDFRYGVLADWARSGELGFVALGHTRDDQAETFLLNLARGSGVDGLSAMPGVVRRHGIRWIRPMLDIGRRELREYLAGEGIRWAEDPGNDDGAFDRVKARNILGSLSPLGLSGEQLAATANHMQRARLALENAARKAACKVARISELGEIRFSKTFFQLDEELRYRLAAQALITISGARYRPRFASLQKCVDVAFNGGKCTLSGCVLESDGDGGMLVNRELNACAEPVPAGEIWDGRWKIAGQTPVDSRLGAFGKAGFAACPDWKHYGHTRSSVAAAPALWRGNALLATAMAGGNGELRFLPVRGTQLMFNAR